MASNTYSNSFALALSVPICGPFLGSKQTCLDHMFQISSGGVPFGWWKVSLDLVDRHWWREREFSWTRASLNLVDKHWRPCREERKAAGSITVWALLRWRPYGSIEPLNSVNIYSYVVIFVVSCWYVLVFVSISFFCSICWYLSIFVHICSDVVMSVYIC